MIQPITAAATRAPAFRDRSGTRQADQAVRGPEPRPSRLWTLIQALAYTGALIDPSGILAFERFRQAQEEQEHHGRR